MAVHVPAPTPVADGRGGEGRPGAATPMSHVAEPSPSQPVSPSRPVEWDLRRLLAALAVLLLGYALFLIVRPFATPLVFAVVMVVIFQPVHARFERRMRPSLAAALSTAVVVLAIIVPASFVATRVVREAIGLAGDLRALPLEDMRSGVAGRAAEWGIDIENLVRNGLQQLAGQAAVIASWIVKDLWLLFVGLLVAILALYFLFRDGKRLLDLAVRVLPMPADLSASLLRDMNAMIASNIAASFLAASIQGTIGGLALAWFGLPAPVLWGVVMGVVCVFPFVGAWLVWGPAALVLAVSGRVWDAVLLAIIGLALVHPVDNILRPAMVAHATKLNGLLVLIGLLGGVRAFGVSGLLLGPVLMSVAASLLSNVSARRA